MGERLNNDFMLENILELYKEKMSRLEYVNPLDNIYINELSLFEKMKFHLYKNRNSKRQVKTI